MTLVDERAAWPPVYRGCAASGCGGEAVAQGGDGGCGQRREVSLRGRGAWLGEDAKGAAPGQRWAGATGRAGAKVDVRTIVDNAHACGADIQVLGGARTSEASGNGECGLGRPWQRGSCVARLDGVWCWWCLCEESGERAAEDVLREALRGCTVALKGCLGAPSAVGAITKAHRAAEADREYGAWPRGCCRRRGVWGVLGPSSSSRLPGLRLQRAVVHGRGERAEMRAVEDAPSWRCGAVRPPSWGAGARCSGGWVVEYVPRGMICASALSAHLAMPVVRAHGNGPSNTVGAADNSPLPPYGNIVLSSLSLALVLVIVFCLIIFGLNRNQIPNRGTEIWATSLDPDTDTGVGSRKWKLTATFEMMGICIQALALRYNQWLHPRMKLMR
ncbi:hypothetical protein DFH06DRAFT_1129409 [Mycena polygramma]|nr:hypothetical protein DFH06DRAFT_1129409 [Mycena polygramma]